VILGVALRVVAGPPVELVVHGGGELCRLPRPAVALDRLLLVRVLPRLQPLLSAALPAARLAGVLDKGTTPAVRSCAAGPCTGATWRTPPAGC